MPNRQDILIEEGMTGAPAWKQSVFWRQRNAARFRQGRRADLSDLVDGLARQLLSRSRAGLGALAEAWQVIIPAEWHSSCRLESFKDGRLLVVVDNAALKYQLSRAWGGRLPELLNQQVGRNAVRSIEYRLASQRSTPAPTNRVRKGR